MGLIRTYQEIPYMIFIFFLNTLEIVRNSMYWEGVIWERFFYRGLNLKSFC